MSSGSLLRSLGTSPLLTTPIGGKSVVTTTRRREVRTSPLWEVLLFTCSGSEPLTRPSKMASAMQSAIGMVTVFMARSNETQAKNFYILNNLLRIHRVSYCQSRQTHAILRKMKQFDMNALSFRHTGSPASRGLPPACHGPIGITRSSSIGLVQVR